MKKIVLTITATCGVAVTLVLAPASVAGQPVTQPLNPPPPSLETCKAAGVADDLPGCAKRAALWPR